MHSWGDTYARSESSGVHMAESVEPFIPDVVCNFRARMAVRGNVGRIYTQPGHSISTTLRAHE